MKVAIVFFKGLDGCGVQRFGEILRSWLVENGSQCDIYFLNMRFARAGVQDYKAFPFDKDSVDEVSKRWNDYDIVITNSYCGRKSSVQLINKCLIAFEKNVVKPIKVGMMHEITLMNMNMIPAIPLWMGLMDQIITFDTASDGAAKITKLMPRCRVYDYTLPFNDNEIERLSNLGDGVPLSQRSDWLVYAGRWSAMKDPVRLFLFKEEQLKHPEEKQLELFMIGLEKSSGCREGILLHPLFNNLIITSGKFSDVWLDRHRDDRVSGYGLYKRDNLFNKVLSKTKFACSFYRLTDKASNNYGNRMEYSMIEMSCLTVPVFDEHWAKNNRLKSSGLTETFEQQNAAILSNKNDIAKTLDELRNLGEDAQAYLGYRQRAIDLIKRENASSHVIPALFQRIMNEGKLSNYYSRKEIGQILNRGDDSELPCVSFAGLGKNEKFEWQVGSSGRLNAAKGEWLKNNLLF